MRGWTKSFAASGTTDGNGDVTISIPAGYFSTITSIQAIVVRATTTPAQYPGCYVRSESTTLVVIRVYESKTTAVLIGGNVEGLETAGPGLKVYVEVKGT